MIDLLFKSLLISGLLGFIYSYFGMEIVRRGIIFTDIAIAQFSAVGLAIGITFLTNAGFLPLIFGLLAAILISTASSSKEKEEEKMEKRKNLTEAFIGMLYSLGLSLSVLILSRNPHGMEEFINLTANDILFANYYDIFKIFALFLIVLIWIILEKRINLIFPKLKELMFFVLFALSVTLSVKIVGVLIIFSLLVSPALVSTLFNKNFIFAWIYGTIVSLAAIIISFHFDFPTGFAIVFLHSFLSILTFFIKKDY